MKALVLLITLSSFLLNHQAHASQNEMNAIKTCLKKFGKHPFNSTNPKYRVIKASVKVFGIGGDINENKKTSEMELVLIKPAVSVLSSTTYRLLNPNAWYCLSAKVAVLAKTTIELDCASRLATTDSGVTVLGSGSAKKSGVTVLGSTKVKRIGCKN